jgi:hypothetical protein
MEGPNVFLCLMALTYLSAGDSKQKYERQGVRIVKLDVAAS